MQVVEPGANLADVFGNEVTREVGFELLFVLERVVELRKRHRAAFEPAIQNFVHSVINDRIYCKAYIINPRTMIVFQLDTG